MELFGKIGRRSCAVQGQRSNIRKLRDRLRAFDDIVLDESDYQEAAACFNRCRTRGGLQGSNTDFLLCAVSLRRHLAIMTIDKDFDGFARVLGFEFHETR